MVDVWLRFELHSARLKWQPIAQPVERLIELLLQVVATRAAILPLRWFSDQ